MRADLKRQLQLWLDLSMPEPADVWQHARQAFLESLGLWQRLALVFPSVAEYPQQVQRLQRLLAILTLPAQGDSLIDTPLSER